jgi:hypothetical protein
LPFANRIVRIDDGRIVGEDQVVGVVPDEHTRSVPGP